MRRTRALKWLANGESDRTISLDTFSYVLYSFNPNGRANHPLPGRHPPQLHLPRAGPHAAQEPPGAGHRQPRGRRPAGPRGIAHAASLLPATSDEANLAALYVAASAQALDCLRLARLYPNDPTVILKCTAQSASMMRQGRAFRSALDRAQTARRKREATPDADATEQQALALMADALAQAPPPEPSRPNPIAEAERYALQHRKRAMLIRRLGHLPPKFGWLPPEAVHAVATGTTPILRALDEKPARPIAVAA